MRLKVLHRTRYLYRSAVQESSNELRLHPASDDPKRVEFFLLTVTPPTRLRSRRDLHFNKVHWFEITDPHDSLCIEASMRIQTTSPYADGLPLGIPFAALDAAAEDEIVGHCLAESRYVSIDAPVWRQALDVQDGCDDIFLSAQRIMEFVHREWSYTPSVTSASTHMREVWENRQGVCQDFAHVMLGMCRALGIPARYVSGYLYNGPLSHLRGAQASHAWCEIFLPGRGWFGLDPTNATLADERYIKIATGRDYEDAAPVIGSFRGPSGAGRGIEVTVEVEEVR